jgi:hypothetical protein
MNFEELFRDFWWLLFPIFGMSMGLVGMLQAESRSRHVMRLIKSYLDQGKEPPPELLKLASQPNDYDMNMSGVASPGQRGNSAWNFVVFFALAAGFSVGYWFVQGEPYAFAFLIVAVTMGVLALGALIILLTSRRP